jgi:prepilin-type N-terminal cleavage/methylation domain-containing protein
VACPVLFWLNTKGGHLKAIFPKDDRMLRVDAATQISDFKSQELEMQRKTFKPSATSKRHQKGYTLIELGIATAILAVLVVGGLTGVQAIMLSGKVSDQAKTLGRLQSTISKHFQNAVTNNGANAGLAQLINLGAWDARSVAGGVVTSAFGTAEALVSNVGAIGTMPAARGFIYTIPGVPQAACTDLAQSLAPMALAISVTAVGGAANWVAADGNATLAKAPDAQVWDAAGIAAACAAQGAAASTFHIALKP